MQVSRLTQRSSRLNQKQGKIISCSQSTDLKIQSTECRENRGPEPLLVAFGMPMCYSQSTDSRVQSTDWHQGCFPAYEMKMLSSSKCNRASTVTRGLCQSTTRSYKLFDASPKTSSNYKAMIFEDLNSKH